MLCMYECIYIMCVYEKKQEGRMIMDVSHAEREREKVCERD